MIAGTGHIGRELTPGELEQNRQDRTVHDRCLALLGGREAGTVEGLFGPDSAMWMLLREVAIPMGGLRAVLMQIAHPSIAAAGSLSSNFQADFLGRARRTFSSMYQMIFGDLQTALRSSQRVRTLHGRIHGKTAGATAPHGVSRLYRANDPALLFWVLATLIDSSVTIYERVIRPLSAGERERYYDDMKKLGMLMGIPDESIPATWADFTRYFDDMVNGTELGVGSAGMTLTHFILNAEWTRKTRLDDILAAGLLPPRWREAYRLPWGAAERRRFDWLIRSLRLGLPRLPRLLRFVPAYHQAQLRMDYAHGRSGRWDARLVNYLDGKVDLPFSLKPVALT